MTNETDIEEFAKALEAMEVNLDEQLKRCPQCGGPLTAMRPTDTSGIPKLGFFCAPCYERTGEI